MSTQTHSDYTSTSTRPKLGIVQRVLTPYRVPLFERLARASDYSVAVFAGQPMVSEPIKVADGPVSFQNDAAVNRYWFGQKHMVVWQTNAVKWLSDFNPDVLVMEANPRLLSHWRVMYWMRRRGRPVLGWGLGELERSGATWAIGLRRFLAQTLIGPYARS